MEPKFKVGDIVVLDESFEEININCYKVRKYDFAIVDIVEHTNLGFLYHIVWDKYQYTQSFWGEHLRLINPLLVSMI